MHVKQPDQENRKECNLPLTRPEMAVLKGVPTTKKTAFRAKNKTKQKHPDETCVQELSAQWLPFLNMVKKINFEVRSLK